jgi:cell division protein FtsL
MTLARGSWICLVMAAFAVLCVTHRGRRAAALQMIALTNARHENLELHGLQSENRQWAAAQLTDEEARRLQQRHSEVEALRSRLLELTKKAGERQAADATENAETAAIPATAWAYVGRATPEAAIQSVLWAASRGDVDRLASMLSFGADDRALAEAMYSQLPPEAQASYGSPQKVVATLLAGTFPKDASAATIGESHQWDEDAALSMDVAHTDGESAMHSNVFRFRRAADGWQLLVPPAVLAGYEKILQGEQPAGQTTAP